jgi:preprotein translocase subunit SecE
MAKQATATAVKAGPVARLKEFYQEVKVEMSKVAWPSKAELKSSTSVVLFLLLVLAAIIGVYDKLFELAVLLLFKLG